MIEREAAVRIAEEQLEIDYLREPAGKRQRMVVLGVTEHELVWIVGWSTEEFARTRDRRYLVVGGGPYLVDRLDGSLHAIGAVSAMFGDWEDDYRSRIRGLPVRAVDDLHRAVREAAATQGILPSVRALRRSVPVLPPVSALGYVRALQDGDAPAHLVAVVTRELVGPFNPVLGVETVRAGSPGVGPTA
ncbi:YrhB domain-containing protein [Kitasatospora griseola]|uniref:YrhB domain-containing protein n=1 Tax=Kitasatospora griseola TaxID=2064 RepID=UPI0034287E11